MPQNTITQDLRELRDSLGSSSEQARQFAYEIKTVRRVGRGVAKLRRALRAASLHIGSLSNQRPGRQRTSYARAAQSQITAALRE